MKTEEITITAQITIEVYDMKDGQIKAFKYNDIVYRAIPNLNTRIRHHVHTGQLNIVEKYITDNNLEFFSLGQFYKDNPTQIYQKARINGYISRLIQQEKILQVGNEKFKVIKKILDKN